jgi:hypothetical protein
MKAPMHFGSVKTNTRKRIQIKVSIRLIVVNGERLKGCIYTMCYRLSFDVLGYSGNCDGTKSTTIHEKIATTSRKERTKKKVINGRN